MPLSTKRTNPEKLSVEYPVINRLKNKMKRNKDITENQVYSFDRRVRRSPVLFEMVKYMQELDNTAEEGEETKHRNMNLQAYKSAADDRLKVIEEKDKVIEEQKKVIEDLKNRIQDLMWADSDEERDAETGELNPNFIYD